MSHTLVPGTQASSSGAQHLPIVADPAPTPSSSFDGRRRDPRLEVAQNTPHMYLASDDHQVSQSDPRVTDQSAGDENEISPKPTQADLDRLRQSPSLSVVPK